jgi:hypothetical protein
MRSLVVYRTFEYNAWHDSLADDAKLSFQVKLVQGAAQPMNKGYAFGFLIVLLVLILGFYVAFTGFMASRDALRAQPTSPSATGAAQATRVPTSPAPTATPTFITIPTPVAGITATLTAIVSADATKPPPPAATNPPLEDSPTPPPPVAEPDTPTPFVPSPPPTPAPNYQFRLAGPPSADANYPNCCYLYGTVRDAAGNGLEGVQVQAFNEWNTLPPSVTKGGNEAGHYDIPIGRDTVTWNLVIIDAAGNRISTQVPVQFDASVANAYRVDWQRTY